MKNRTDKPLDATTFIKNNSRCYEKLIKAKEKPTIVKTFEGKEFEEFIKNQHTVKN